MFFCCLGDISNRLNRTVKLYLKRKTGVLHMNENENKQVVINAYTALGSGDGNSFIGYLNDDIHMTLFGNHKMSRTFQGKKDILENMVPLMRSKILGHVKLHIRNVITEGENVVIEMEGESKTQDGREYNNKYCFWVRVNDGKIVETREYMDTELVKSIFG